MRNQSLYPVLALAACLAAIALGGAYAHLAGLWIWLGSIQPITWFLALFVALGMGLIIGGASVWVGVALLRQDVQAVPSLVADRIQDLANENEALNQQLDRTEAIMALLIEPDLLIEGHTCRCCGSQHSGLATDPWNPEHHEPLLVLDKDGNDAWIDCPITLALEQLGQTDAIAPQPAPSTSSP